ncbi:MFS transporter [Streptomyces sp. NPDC047315]|uniref:MFS transporter n=1 Tax=Streptomyces sp. NPDC047315 TaxID=3155142 RepID=UPI00340FF65B
MAIHQGEQPATASEAGAVDAPALRRTAAWGVVAVLVGLMFVNYADKVVVGLAGVDMKKDLGLGSDEFGIIQSSFFWLFAVGCILGGWLAGKVKVRWLLVGMTVLWAASLAPIAAQAGFTTIVICRIVLGFAEGPTMALAMQVAHSWFPAHKRAVPSSVVIAGAGVGPVVASPLLTWVITDYSWRAAFGVLAVVGLVFTVLCLLVGREGPEATSDGPGHGEPAVTELPERVPLGRLFRTGTLVGMLMLFFVAYACTSVKVSWLPLYLREGLGYSAEATGKLVALPFLGSALAVIGAGLLSRALTKRGIGNHITRGILPGAFVLASAVATLTFPLLEAGVVQMALIVASSCLNSAGYGVAFAGLADVAPAKQRGVVFGIVTAVYSLGAVIAPVVIGKLVASGDSAAAGYGAGFTVLGVTMAVGAIAALFLVNPSKDAAKLAAQCGDPARVNVNG